MTTPLADIPKVWLDFLFDVELADSHWMANFRGPQLRNQVVERIMPSLLHVKAAAVFDHALEGWIADRGLSMPKKYRDNLHGRIEFLWDSGHVSNAPSLHAIRATRNDVAHEPEKSIDWKTLRNDIATLNSALEELGIVEALPRFQVKGTQHAAVDGLIPNAITSQKFDLTVTASNGTRKVLGWISHTMKD